MKKNGEDSMIENIQFESISNVKLAVESNEQLFSLIKKTAEKYKLEHSEIITKYFEGKNLLKIFELNRRRYKYTRDGYLSKLSLTYILVYFDIFLTSLEKIYRRKSISQSFLDEYFEDENKLTYFCSDIVGEVFNVKYRNLSNANIERNVHILLVYDFLTGLNKMKLYYNIYFGRVCNRYIMNYKTDKEKDEILYFIYKISKDLKDNEILYIYNLCKKNMEKLTKQEHRIMKNIVNTFDKKDSNIIVQPNFLLEEDIKIIESIPNFLKKATQEMTFSDFKNSSTVISKEGIEVYKFQVKVNINTYDFKVRKILGKLHFYLYDEEKIIYKDRIYFLDDLNRFLIVIKEYNKIKENNYNFWNS